MKRTTLAFALFIPALFSGCNALRNVDTSAAGTGPNSMLDDTAVGKHRCAAGKANESPFVVEWDATDLSTFEAKASRDLVFVKYEGCSIELLYGCSDNSIPGKYGRYGEPTFTSGTVESFTMKNEDELYAKLPLGAVQFASNVKLGETLALEYYVSGVVNATRSYVERPAIDGNPRCAGATHFVSAFNLGAFELKAARGLTGEAGVTATVAEGGARTTSESSNLKHGGSLDSCETQTQRQCRVPIRLVLQGIDEATASAADPAATVTPVAPINPTRYEDTPAARASALRRSADEKEQAGDGPGCLQDLERARALDDSEHTRKQSLYLTAQCTMRAGECGEGKELLREYLKAIDERRTTTDAQITVQVDTAARSKCPLAHQKTPGDKVARMHSGIGEAEKRGDPAGCVAMGEHAVKLTRKVDMNDVKERNSVAGVFSRVSTCLSALERCDEARKWWHTYYEAAFSTMMAPDQLKKTADQQFDYQPACKGN